MNSKQGKKKRHASERGGAKKAGQNRAWRREERKCGRRGKVMPVVASRRIAGGQETGPGVREERGKEREGALAGKPFPGGTD